MGREYDFSRRMEAAQRAAKIARNTGRHVGASAKGWDYKRPELDRDDWHDLVRMVANNWRAERDSALNDYAAAALNLKHREDYNDCPF